MILIGTSGWSYRHWSGGAFYPMGLASSRWLEYYVRRFATVELNASFYRLPRAEMVERWRELAPPGFAFSAKGSRLITHARRMKGCEEAVRTFMERGSASWASRCPSFSGSFLPTWSAVTRTWPGSTHSWSFFQVTCGMQWSSAIDPGSATRLSRCCATGASRK
jgi:hypothetical protein